MASTDILSAGLKGAVAAPLMDTGMAGELDVSEPPAPITDDSSFTLAAPSGFRLADRVNFSSLRTFEIQKEVLAWMQAHPNERFIAFLWGDTPYGAPPRVLTGTALAVASRLHKYAPVAGEAALLPLIVKDFERFGVTGLDPNKNVCVTNGCLEGLALSSLVLLNPGDDAILLAPYYHAVRMQALLAQANVRVVFGDPENKFKITPDQLSKAITDKARVIYLTNPTNPVGEYYTLEELRALAEVIAPHEGLGVIADEIYERLYLDGGIHASFWQAAPELRHRTVVLSSLSKNAGLSGLRIGWIGGSEKIIGGVKAIKIPMTWGTSTLGQAAAFVALSDGEAYEKEVEQVRKDLRTGRDLLSRRLMAMGFDFVDAPAGMFLYPKVPDGLNLPAYDDTISLGERFARALIPFGLSVAPGIDMGVGDRFRIAFSLTQEDINLGMDRMEEALRTFKAH